MAIDNREVRICAFCGTAFHPVRELQRFHSKDCHDRFYVEERRKALEAYRAAQAARNFFTPLDSRSGDQDRKAG
jgi:hypothetical protein